MFLMKREFYVFFFMWEKKVVNVDIEVGEIIFGGVGRSIRK